MRTHRIDIDVLVKTNANAALVGWNIKFWSAVNLKLGNVDDDGRPWWQATMAEFEKRHDYLSKDQIRGALDKLEKAGLIMRREGGKNRFDRSLSYSWSSMWEISQLDVGDNPALKWEKSQLRAGENPNSYKEDIENNEKKNDNVVSFDGDRESLSDTESPSAAKLFDRAWKLYNSTENKANQVKKTALAAWKRATKKTDPEIILAAIQAEVDARSNSEQWISALPQMQRWLKEERWESIETTTKPETPENAPRKTGEQTANGQAIYELNGERFYFGASGPTKIKEANHARSSRERDPAMGEVQTSGRTQANLSFM